MKAGGALVLTADPRAAAAQAVDQAIQALGDTAPSLAVLFASPHFLTVAEDLIAAIAEQAGPLPLIGCVGQAVAGPWNASRPPWATAVPPGRSCSPATAADRACSPSPPTTPG